MTACLGGHCDTQALCVHYYLEVQFLKWQSESQKWVIPKGRELMLLILKRAHNYILGSNIDACEIFKEEHLR